MNTLIVLYLYFCIAQYGRSESGMWNHFQVESLWLEDRKISGKRVHKLRKDKLARKKGKGMGREGKREKGKGSYLDYDSPRYLVRDAQDKRNQWRRAGTRKGPNVRAIEKRNQYNQLWEQMDSYMWKRARMEEAISAALSEMMSVMEILDDVSERKSNAQKELEMWMKDEERACEGIGRVVDGWIRYYKGKVSIYKQKEQYLSECLRGKKRFINSDYLNIGC